MSAIERRHGGEWNLVPAARHDGPLVLLAEELVGDALRVQKILRIGTLTAQNAEDRLHEERRRDELSVEEMRERVEMTDVVALELESRAVALAEAFQDSLDIRKRVAKNPVTRGLEERLLPLVLEMRIAADHRVHAEIHRTRRSRRGISQILVYCTSVKA